MLGGGHLMVQSMAGRALVTGDTAGLASAQALYRERPAPWNFEWTWGSSNAESELALAAGLLTA